jgi:hypothetical protein
MMSGTRSAAQLGSLTASLTASHLVEMSAATKDAPTEMPLCLLSAERLVLMKVQQLAVL